MSSKKNLALPTDVWKYFIQTYQNEKWCFHTEQTWQVTRAQESCNEQHLACQILLNFQYCC